MATTVLNIPDISCEHCERTITNALTPVEGVRTVNVDIPAKQVRGEYDESVVDVNKMQKVLDDEDYPVASVATIEQRGAPDDGEGSRMWHGRRRGERQAH